MEFAALIRFLEPAAVVSLQMANFLYSAVVGESLLLLERLQIIFPFTAFSPLSTSSKLEILNKRRILLLCLDASTGAY